VRHFNRFYTEKIGLLRKRLLNSRFSLTEGRVMYELANRTRPTATEIGNALHLDPGYLSRILQGFQRRGLVEKKQSADDGRQSILRLTMEGRRELRKLDLDAQKQMNVLMKGMRTEDIDRMIASMRAIESLLEAQPGGRSYTLRTHAPGDIGWVIERHGALYAEEYGWNHEFEALVGEVASKFLRAHDPERERCWIAEIDGERVGSVFLVKSSPSVAKLRLLLVDPKARGLGLGRRLVDECIAFARARGYRKLTLWTNSVLDAARHIYEGAGFTLVEEVPQHIFGKDLVSQTWEMKL
jgi:DNA-binding MarR family transcriptional regulator/ribosomal protein S18 acetylase RimI-like enzyme